MGGVPAVPPVPPMMGAGYTSSASSGGYSAYKVQAGGLPSNGYTPGKGMRGYPPNAGGGY